MRRLHPCHRDEPLNFMESSANITDNGKMLTCKTKLMINPSQMISRRRWQVMDPFSARRSGQQLPHVVKWASHYVSRLWSRAVINYGCVYKTVVLCARWGSYSRCQRVYTVISPRWYVGTVNAFPVTCFIIRYNNTTDVPFPITCMSRILSQCDIFVPFQKNTPEGKGFLNNQVHAQTPLKLFL